VLPDKPSIAVLLVANLSGELDQELLLRQSPRQIWRDIAAGKLAVVRLDGSTRVTPEAVAARIGNASA